MTTNTNATPARSDATAAQRHCAHCDTPLPTDARANRKYCGHNCARKASYHRKSPEERREINKRSNQYRFEKKLLPNIRFMAHASDAVEPGSEAAKDAVRMFLKARFTNWRLDLALNFNSARNALATMAGGHTELDRLEEEVFDHAVTKMDKKEAAA